MGAHRGTIAGTNLVDEHARVGREARKCERNVVIEARDLLQCAVVLWVRGKREEGANARETGVCARACARAQVRAPAALRQRGAPRLR